MDKDEELHGYTHMSNCSRTLSLDEKAYDTLQLPRVFLKCRALVQNSRGVDR